MFEFAYQLTSLLKVVAGRCLAWKPSTVAYGNDLDIAQCHAYAMQLLFKHYDA